MSHIPARTRPPAGPAHTAGTAHIAAATDRSDKAGAPSRAARKWRCVVLYRQTGARAQMHPAESHGTAASTPGTPSVCIAFAYGCPRAQSDLALLYRYFERNGWTCVDRAPEADLVVVSMCGVTEEVQHQSLQLLSDLRRPLRSGTRLVAVGCLPGIQPDQLRRDYGCLTVPPRDLTALDGIIGARVPLRDVPDLNAFDPLVRRAYAVFGRISRFRSWLLRARAVPVTPLRLLVKVGRLIAKGGLRREPVFFLRIARGCLGECSYCAVRFAAGTLISKPVDEIVSEFRGGLASGARHFKLLAGYVACYGQDIGTNLPALLRRILQHQGQYVLHLADLHPAWLLAFKHDFLEVLAAYPQHFGELLIPAQSGSDRILQAMGRGHTAEDLLDLVGGIRRAAPGAVLHTHVLIGFPGETQEDFEATLDFLECARFDRIVVYPYSDRPGTPASNLPGHVAPRVIRDRIRRLRKRFPRT